jgi:enterochelin esterase family protein
VRYLHGPDSVVRPEVPVGTVTELAWTTSSVFPGSTRRFWVYVPAQYDAAVPASLLVLQDGAGFLDPEDDLRTTVVLDNLIASGDLPVTIAVFVDPGTVEGVPDRKARNAEYDPFDDRYATFLLEEIVPEVTRRWSVSDDHGRWAIGGFSSGGSCAFTVAWQRPDAFRRVVCFLPSFAQIPGGNPYPALIPTTPRKPLRVFVQAAHRDLGWDEPEDNWLANILRTAAALAEAEYDVRLVLGDGGHDSNHAGALLPDALRWAFGASTSA